MSAKIRSLKQLGKGKWRINAVFGSSGPTYPMRRGKRNLQHELFELVNARYPEALPNYVGAIPTRKYEVDIALPSHRLAIEVDGWQFHGKRLADFKRDREKDRLLILNDWRVVRFCASEILKKPDDVMATIEQVVAVVIRERDG